MGQWWIAAVAPVLGGLGYLVRRALEGRRRGEKLEHRLRALTLWRGMRREGLTLDELDRLGDE